MQHPKCVELLISNQSETGRPNLTLEDIRNFKFILPPLHEQQKSADILRVWDKTIDAVENLIISKERLKNGVMQQLLTGEKRFKEFKKESRKVIKLGEITEINKGVQLNKLDMIPDGKFYALNGGIEPSGYTNKWNTNENTITISEGGNSCGYINYNEHKFWCGGHCYAIEEIDGKVDKIFLYHLLKHNESKIMKLRVGSGLPNIQKSALEKFTIGISENISEQKKIASVLSKADDEIKFLKNQLKSFREKKKGLMQVLLTGKKKS